MSRKNLIEFSTTQAPVAERAGGRDERPIAGFVPATRSAVPVGGITKTLGNITEKMERAQNLERQLAEGQTVVELDTALIDGSFVNDRLEIGAIELGQLVEQIREHGQQVPILVRAHPDVDGRFQVAYGHRRLAAIKQLGLKIRAVVRDLTDDQLVVSQGQENNSRMDLSYIERALFARRLDEREFKRDIIMSALGVDKAALSKMLIIMRQVPLELIIAIGPAPQIGRRRWLELGERVEGKAIDHLVEELSADYSKDVSSDQRFQRVMQMLLDKPAHTKVSTLVEQTVDAPVTIKKTKSGVAFLFNTKAAPGFNDFVQQRLKDLYAEFKRKQGD